MNKRMINFYMGLAHECAKMSRAKRLNVGCVIVKENNIISFSWNGTPAGWDNECETKEYLSGGAWLDEEYILDNWPFEEIEKNSDGTEHIKRYKLVTKPEVLHAERNALDKLAKTYGNGQGATLFTTHAPCLECAKSIGGAGIKEVYYSVDYRSAQGIEHLERSKIQVIKLLD